MTWTRMTRDQLDTMTTMYHQGYTFRAIGEVFGVRPGSIYYWLRKEGVIGVGRVRQQGVNPRQVKQLISSPSEPLLSIDEVAARLNFSRGGVFTLIGNAKFSTVKQQGAVFVKERELVSFVEENWSRKKQRERGWVSGE